MLSDFRFAIRLLLKDRTFTITALLTLALCIGANTAIFSIVRSVLLRPLPVPDAGRIMQVYNSYPNAGSAYGGAGVPDYFDRVKDASAFEVQALYRTSGVTLGAAAGAERLIAVRGTPSFYRLVQVQPQLGRIFTEDEGEIGKNRQVILSDGLWHREYGGDKAVVGREIRLGGEQYHVVGVMPRDFKFLWSTVDVWLPEAFTPAQKSDDGRHNNSWEQIGRLKPGATAEQAQAQMDAINARNDERFPHFKQILHDAGFRTVVVPLQDKVVREIRPVLYLLWGGVLFLLLLGSVNIANLVLTRSSARARELATRHAIGADRRRLARQLVTETTALAAAGGVIGLVLGSWALRAVTALGLDEIPRAHEIQLDLTAAGIIFALAVGVGLLIGLVPVARLSRLDVTDALRDEGRSGTSSRGTNLLRKGLATAQVAIAFILLVGAGLLVASFRQVLKIDPGFQPAGVVTASISLPAASYKDETARSAFTERALAAIRALPGVEAAGTTDTIPFGNSYSDSVILPEGYQMKPGESLISPFAMLVSDGYFEAMRVPLLKGRRFTPSDTAASLRVVIIDERLAEKFWPGRDPIGRRIYRPENPKDLLAVGPDTKFITVVGVVKEIRLSTIVAAERAVGAYYFPQAQEPNPSFVLAIRARGNADAIVGEARKAIAAIDSTLPLYRVRTMTERVDNALVSRRVPMLLALGFGIVALFLSSIGVYGVLAYGVSQRRREIGIRLALGSTPREVFGLVLGDGAVIAGAGLLIGLAGAVAAGRAMQSMLYEVQPMDPLVLGLVAVGLAAVALVATAIPAVRATKINPLTALNS